MNPRQKRTAFQTTIVWMRRVVLAVAAFMLLLLLAGATYQAIGNWRDAQRFPQQGKTVQAGRLKLNLDCRGQGAPTVILEGGVGEPAFSWFKVQPEVARFTRVCAYDRAGYGWSDAGPEPRTSDQIARELRALLDVAGERGPYVMVGHSSGGFNVRVFAARYQSDVSGVVLVDASHEDQMSRMQNVLSPSAQAKEKESEEGDKWLERIAPLLIDVGVQRLAMKAGLGPPVAYLTTEQMEELTYLNVQSKARQAISSEANHFEDSATEVRAAGNLRDRPLIVLSGGKDEDDDPALTQTDRDAQRNLWINVLQTEQTHLSTSGRQIILPDSGHMIPLERPDAVASAIHDVWMAARRGSDQKQKPTRRTN
jgi:pimeloyl-ACP methyl ester carboxylesterase